MSEHKTHKKKRDRIRHSIALSQGQLEELRGPGPTRWTSQQELQLVKKRSNCLAHKWMHYRMARLKSLFANLLGFPLVIVGGVATAAQYYSQTQECDSSQEKVTVGGVIAMIFATLLTILTALSAWLKPSEAAELHRQVSITYQVLVDQIESEIASADQDREDGRVFIKDIENKIELLAQNAPSVPWFIMKNYVTDWADERERELKLESDPNDDQRLSVSRSVRVERVSRTKDEEDDFDLMDNFKRRLQDRIKQETNSTLQYQLDRAKEMTE